MVKKTQDIDLDGLENFKIKLDDKADFSVENSGKKAVEAKPKKKKATSTKSETKAKEQPQVHNSSRRSSKRRDLIVSTNPKSSFAESIKAIKTNILFSSVDTKLKTILVTSPRPGDGKSFVIANLAAAFGQDGKKVLVIDADLRKGRQHNIFGIINNPNTGYSNLIIKFEEKRTKKDTFEQSIQQYLINTEVENVTLLPNGPTPPNPLELLASETNNRILTILKDKFDIILFDCPPVLGLSDTLVMTKYSNANILTVSSRKTKTDELNEALRAFEKANSKVFGIVLNKVKAKQTSYSSYYTSKYYSN